MAATLNPEPSLSTERQEHHLPPKSYADAAVENMSPDANQDNTSQALYAGQGEDDAPRKPQRNLHKKTGSLRVNGFSKDNKEPHVVVERFEDKDGEHLVSITPGLDSKRGKPSVARRNSELVSGRKAGARWEQSRYGHIQTTEALALIESSIQHPLRSSVGPLEETSPDPCGPRPYSQRCLSSRLLLPALLHSALLASTRTLPHLRPLLQCRLFRYPEVSI